MALAQEVPDHVVEAMQEIVRGEYRGSISLGTWAEQSAARDDDPELTEIIEIVAFRERENCYAFTTRLRQLGHTVVFEPRVAPPTRFTDQTLSDVEKLTWLYGSPDGHVAIDEVASYYSGQEAMAVEWPEHERSLVAHYLFNERHTAMLLIDAWIRRAPEAGLATARFNPLAELYAAKGPQEAATIAFALVMRPLGENVDNWRLPYAWS